MHSLHTVLRDEGSVGLRDLERGVQVDGGIHIEQSSLVTLHQQVTSIIRKFRQEGKCPAIVHLCCSNSGGIVRRAGGVGRSH